MATKKVWRVDASNELPGRGRQTFVIQGRTRKDLDKRAKSFEASNCKVDWSSVREVEIPVD